MEEAEVRGVSIYNVDSRDKVEEFVKGDPAVRCGHFAYSIFNWFGVPGDSFK